MENGTFHTSVRSVLDMDEIIEKIPLPNQIPSPPDLSKLPPEALRSSAVETLLGQNADLMARLGVALRKNGILDTKLNELEKENLHLRHRYDAIKDSVLVVQEKERMLTTRNTQISAEAETMRSRLVNLERGYTDVYLHAQSLEHQLRRFRNYRARVQAVLKNLKTHSKRLMDFIGPNAHPTSNVAKILQSAEQEIRTVRFESSEAQHQLVSRYETELSQLRQCHENELTQTKSDLEIAKRRAADRDLLFEAKIRIENQLIFEERQNRVYREETQKELQTLKEENIDLRGQLKTRLIEMERLERELKVASEHIQNLESHQNDQVDQVESLQLLWKEKQAEVERLEEKNRSLQKLNQQLSVNLNMQRKEIVDLKADLEKDRYASAEKIHALETQLTQRKFD